jgi:hypothetical protein
LQCTPGLKADIARLPIGAMRGYVQVQQTGAYSMTSSAMASKALER